MSIIKESPTWTEVQNPSEIFLPPNVSLTIIFSRHAKATDVGDREAFRQLVRSSHVFIPETLGWSNKELHDVNRICMGDAGVYQQYVSWQADNDYGDFNRMELSALYASHVKVQFIDIPHDHQLFGEFQALRGNRGVSDDPFYIQPTYELTMSQLADAKKHEALLQKLREDYIIAQLGPRLRMIVDPNPKLAGSPKVDVVYVIGNEHTRIFDILQKTIVPQKSGLPRVRAVYSPSVVEIQETTILNHFKGKTLSKKHEQRILAELLAKGVFLGMLVSAGKDFYDYSTPLASAVRSLSDEQLRSVYESIDIRARNVNRSPEMLSIVRQLNLDGIFK